MTSSGGGEYFQISTFCDDVILLWSLAKQRTHCSVQKNPDKFEPSDWSVKVVTKCTSLNMALSQKGCESNFLKYHIVKMQSMHYHITINRKYATRYRLQIYNSFYDTTKKWCLQRVFFVLIINSGLSDKLAFKYLAWYCICYIIINLSRNLCIPVAFQLQMIYVYHLFL